MNALEAAAVIAGGMGAGAINVIAGSGTLLSFPILLAVGYPSVTANVSNNIGLVPGTISAVYNTREGLEGQAPRARRLAVGSASGALVGAALLLTLDSDVFDAVVPILVILAATLMLIQPLVAARVAASREARGRSASPQTGAIAPIVCFFAGIYGGYFGAAQGIILLATLGVLLPDALARTNSLKNVLVGVVNGVAAVFFVIFGSVAWLAVALIAVGSVAGAAIGARVSKRVPVPVLRGFIVCLGYAVAIKLILT
ncbi:MAG: sulfite exporter TauE/SafE family protein [Actinobacteria bacterium]|nr:sulfite exporter TauE/SafE family protein [Actinomycetota bacterium]